MVGVLRDAKPKQGGRMRGGQDRALYDKVLSEVGAGK